MSTLRQIGVYLLILLAIANGLVASVLWESWRDSELMLKAKISALEYEKLELERQLADKNELVEFLRKE